MIEARQAGLISRRFLAVLLIAAIVAGLPGPSGASTARAAPSAGEDVCPEPNDAFQNACNLGPGADALGFLSAPDDVDAYRVMALDFNTRLTVHLAGQPYRLQLYDWNGTMIAESPEGPGGQTLRATLPLPGAYYVGVVSQDGSFSDGVPYRIGAEFGYTVGAPEILYAGEFREGGVIDGHVGDYTNVEYRSDAGRYIVSVKSPGTPTNVRGGFASWGPVVRDFVMAVDTRAVGGSDMATIIALRRVDANNYLSVWLEGGSGRIALLKYNGGTRTDITGWQPATGVRTDGSVNRVVVRYVGADILVNVNGTEVLRATDDSLPVGQVGLGTATWGNPAEVYFDNLLITTPPGVAASPMPPPRAPASGEIVLSENFDDPRSGQLPKESSNPTRTQLGYVDGEYVVKRLDTSTTGSVLLVLNGTPSNGSLAVDARIVGDTDGRYFELRCRYRNNGNDFYVMAVMPHDGLYQILRIQDNRVVPPEVWRESAAIRRGNAKNRIELQCVGSTLAAIINGERVLELQDGSIPDGVFAFGAGNTVQKPGLVEARYDDLLLVRR